MSLDLGITLAVLVVAAGLMVSNRLRPDLVALLAVVTLGASGVLTTQETFSGFSRSAVITLLAIFILAEGLQQSGVAAVVAGWIIRATRGREARMVVVVMLAGSLFSLVMNNIASAAVLLPGVSTAAKRSGVSPSRVLMPLAFSTILGGMATLLTTSNIVVSTLLQDRGFEGFGLLDFAPMGLVIVVVGIGYMALVGRRRLPVQSMAERFPEAAAPDLVGIYRLPERLFRARVPPGSRLIGRPLTESTLREDFRLDVVAVERDGRTRRQPPPDFVVELGDVLVVQGDLADFRRRDIEPFLEILPPRDWSEELQSTNTAVVEALLAPRSSLEGKTLREAHFRDRFGMTVLAVWRAGQPLSGGLTDLPLQLGDGLLLQGRRKRLEHLRDEPDLIVLDEHRDGETRVPVGRRWLAAAVMVTTLVVAVVSPLSIGEVMLSGALVMVLLRLLSMDQAYQAIEWRTIFLVAGMLPLGIALSKTGAADLLAHGVLAAAGPWGPRAIMGGLFLLTALLVQAINGAAVAAVMAPVAITAATGAGMDPRAVAMAVALGTSMAFITPLGHPVNLLVMGSGGYTFRDYMRVGGPMALLLFLVVMLVLPLIWPLTPG